MIFSIINIFIIIAITILSYNLVIYIKDKKVSIDSLLDKDDAIEEINKIKAFYSYKQKKELKIIRIIRTLIFRSTLKHKFINVNTILLTCLITSLVISKSVSEILIAIQLVMVAVSSFFIPIVILFLYSEHIGNKTNYIFTDFLNTLENFLNIKEDLGFAMEEISKLDTLFPLNEYCKDYAFEINHGGSSKEAITRLSEKVDNAQFKYLMKGLLSCENSTGKYMKVVNRHNENYRELYKEFLKKKKEASKRRGTQFAILGICIAILFFLNRINRNMMDLLLYTKAGNILSTILFLAVIFMIYVAIDVGRFKFE